MANYASAPQLNAELVVNFDYGNSIGLACLCPYSDNFIVLKENGCLQIWNNREKSLIGRLLLNEKSSCISAHPSMPLVVVGTEKGSLIFIDFTNNKSPRVIKQANVHKEKPCRRLKSGHRFLQS